MKGKVKRNLLTKNLPNLLSYNNIIRKYHLDILGMFIQYAFEVFYGVAMCDNYAKSHCNNNVQYIYYGCGISIQC